MIPSRFWVQVKILTYVLIYTYPSSQSQTVVLYRVHVDIALECPFWSRDERNLKHSIFCAQVYKHKGGNNLKEKIPCPYLFVEKPLSLMLTSQLVWKITPTSRIGAEITYSQINSELLNGLMEKKSGWDTLGHRLATKLGDCINCHQTSQVDEDLDLLTNMKTKIQRQ